MIGFLENILDWGNDHPHTATILVFLFILVYVFLSIITAGWFFIITISLCGLALIYAALYNGIKNF